MAAHRLDPLLRPDSIAVVGASPREGSPGNEALVNLRAGDYAGKLYGVNPAYDSIGELACYPSLSTLPTVPVHVVFVVGDDRLEPLFAEALELGVQACTIFSSLQLPGDSHPGLRERIRRRAEGAGVLLHGANCMGFLNIRDGVRVSAFDTRIHRKSGNVALLSQSGAGMSGILDCEQRLDFNFAASTGQELCVSMEDYLDFVLDLPETRVVGLFLETSRHPAKFLAALQKAQSRQIPIVVVKVGRSALAARLAVSHSGALAGSDASYQAVFDRFGVQRVEDMAQLATALIMFAQPREVAPGAVVTLHDSGGEQQLAIDLADQLDVPLAQLHDSTRDSLRALLDEGMPAVNPLDAWGSGGPLAGQHMSDCFSLLMKDPNAAMGAVVHDRAPEGRVYPQYLEYLHRAASDCDKPVFLVANHQGSGHDDQVVASTRAGFPVVDGLREFLIGARALMAYRSFKHLPPDIPPQLDDEKLAIWRQKLSDMTFIGEALAMEVLADFGIPMAGGESFDSRAGLLNGADRLQYPVVMKTAAEGIAHKSEHAGVVLGLEDPAALLCAYDEMASRLGPAVLVSPMVDEEGVEMVLGVACDDQFGPMIVVGFGGIYTELVRDVVVLVPPFASSTARAAIDQLKQRPLLDAARGRAALKLDAFAEAAARLSVLAIELEATVAEIDINPMKLTPDGCVGLDALLVPRQGNTLDVPVPEGCDEGTKGEHDEDC